jgi:poly(A) polymerase
MKMSKNSLKSDIAKIDLLKLASQIAFINEIKVFIVGGFVRDLLLGRKKGEIDFLVLGDGNQFAEILANKLGEKKVVQFKNFGTAHFHYKGYELEFVGARKESYRANSRKPKVETATFEEDISRRDFTMNCLAISINKDSFGEIIDLYDGKKDIEDMIIKTPLDPLVTFNDDPLRIMRAFRFATQLNFSVSDAILQAATELRERLEIVSQERITDEFFKILASPSPSIGLILLYESKVLEIIFPEIYNLAGIEQRKDYHHKDVFFHTCEVVDNISKVTDNVWLRFAALVHDIAKPQTKRFVEGTGWTFHGHEEMGARMMKHIFKRMKLSLNKLDYIEKLVRLHLRPIALAKEEVTDSAIRRFIVDAGEDLADLITLCRADITSKNMNKVSRYLENYEKVMQKVWEVEEKDKLRAFQSPVRGEEIMEVFGISPGKQVGDIKKKIEEAILEGTIGNNHEEAYQFLLKLKDNEM